MTDLTVVTGSNRGIGLALTRALAERGASVLAACRTSSAELDALGVEVVPGVDVASEQGTARLREAVAERSVGLLINNAGIMRSDSLSDPKPDALMEQFRVNAVGPLLVTSALRSRFRSGTKLAFITSRMGSIADNTSGGRYGYRMSKTALNMAATSVAHDLADSGVLVAILHPGWVSTDMVGGHGQIEPAQAAAGLLARIDALTPESSGTFWHQNGEVLPW